MRCLKKRQKPLKNKEILELKNTLTKVKNSMKSFDSGVKQAEYRDRKLEDRSFNYPVSGTKRKKE